jgi:hypothetical protein
MEPFNPYEAGLKRADEYQIWQPDNTDKAFIFFIVYRNLLNKIVESIDKAGDFFTQSKEYYFTVNSPILIQPKQYSGKEIILLKKYSASPYIYSHTFDKMCKQDQFYLIIMKLKTFIEKVHKSIDDANLNYIRMKDFFFTFIPPLDLFERKITPSKSYSAKQIMMLTEYAKIYSEGSVEFPEPIYWKAKQAVIDASDLY